MSHTSTHGTPACLPRLCLCASSHAHTPHPHHNELPHPVLRVDICFGVDEHLHHVAMSVVCRPMQPCALILEKTRKDEGVGGVTHKHTRHARMPAQAVPVRI